MCRGGGGGGLLGEIAAGKQLRSTPAPAPKPVDARWAYKRMRTVA